MENNELILPFRPCSIENMTTLKRKLEEMPSGYFDVTTRLLGIEISVTISREDLKLPSGRSIKFDPITPGIYRVREILNTDGEYGWQFISPRNGGIMCNHNRNELLKNNLYNVQIISEECY